MVMAANVTIADLSITGMRNHAISIKCALGADATHIYKVHLYDIGTQHIKGTPSSGDGAVACSKFSYSPNGVQGDYINGIDIHGATNWVVHDNEIYNIWLIEDYEVRGSVMAPSTGMTATSPIHRPVLHDTRKHRGQSPREADGSTGGSSRPTGIWGDPG